MVLVALRLRLSVSPWPRLRLLLWVRLRSDCSGDRQPRGSPFACLAASMASSGRRASSDRRASCASAA
jgi:hypothetical protein